MTLLKSKQKTKTKQTKTKQNKNFRKMRHLASSINITETFKLLGVAEESLLVDKRSGRIGSSLLVVRP